jgi:putative dehydrogenase
MKNVGVVGLGNMGMGMAKNLMAAGYKVAGTARTKATMDAFAEIGGHAMKNGAEIGANADLAFVMVFDAKQTNEVVSGKGGLLETMKPGSVIVITATIGKAAIQKIAAQAKEKGVRVIDCPVSGGKKGADAGELTLMISGDKRVFDDCIKVFQAIGKNINYVGEEVGMGQVAKACLQGLVGCIYSGIFEAMVLGVKAGVSAESLYSIIGTSVANTPLFQTSVPAIMDRKFSGTGSNVGTMYKDLSITLGVAEECGVPMMATSAAKQFFQAGIAKFPNEDNHCLIKVLEDITGAEVRRAGAAR